MFKLTDEIIDTKTYSDQLTNFESGGVVHFEGRVRNHNQGMKVSALEYQVYPELAQTQGQLIIQEALIKFNIHSAICVHRYGHLSLGDIAVWIGVGASHRDAAFKACRYIIDQIKLRLPIWKKEHYLDAKAQWVFCKDHHTHVHLCEHEYYQKQQNLIEQNKFSNARVLVVGAGGLAATVLPALTSAGIGNLAIVDFDKIESSNLHRQTLFSVSDIGEKKVSVVAQKMQSLNPLIKIKTIANRLDESNYREILSGFDLLVDCTDNLETKLLLHDACHILRIPLISASIYKFEAKIRTFIPGLGCLRCDDNFEQMPDEQLGNCNDVGVLGASVMSAGSLLAHEALLYLQKQSNNSIENTIFIDFETLTFHRFKNLKREDCDCCQGKIEILDEKISLSLNEVTEHRAIIIDWDVPKIEEIILKNEIVAIKCKRGIRARALTKMLRAKGHKNVFALRME